MIGIGLGENGGSVVSSGAGSTSSCSRSSKTCSCETGLFWLCLNGFRVETEETDDTSSS